MGTEVTTTTKSLFGGGKVTLRNVDAIAKAMQASANDGALGVAPEGSQYLNFSGKRGVYEFGQDKADLTEQELWVVNCESFQAGWVCWKGGAKLAQRMASIFGDAQVPPPNFEEHGPFKEGEGWQKAKAFVLRSLDRDAQAFFTTNSKSGVAVVADLQQQIVDRMGSGSAFWPVVQFGREKFQAKGNWNFKPTIIVYGWLNTAAIAKLAEDPEQDIDDLLDAVETGTVAALDAATAEPEVEDAEVEEVEAEVEPEVEDVPETNVRANTARRRRAGIEAAKATATPEPAKVEKRRVRL